MTQTWAARSELVGFLEARLVEDEQAAHDYRLEWWPGTP